VTDEQKHTDEEQPGAAQADLEVSDEDAERVDGGGVGHKLDQQGAGRWNE
jgi:hypothetical protein